MPGYTAEINLLKSLESESILATQVPAYERMNNEQIYAKGQIRVDIKFRIKLFRSPVIIYNVCSEKCLLVLFHYN